MSDRWLTADEAAAYIGLSRKALYERVRRGQIPAHRLGRALRFKASEIDQVLEAGGQMIIAQLPLKRRPSAQKGGKS